MQTQQQLDVKCYGRLRRSLDSVHPARRSGVPEVLEGRPDRAEDLVKSGGEWISSVDLMAHLATDLAQWQLPERFEFVDVIPRTVGRQLSHIVRM